MRYIEFPIETPMMPASVVRYSPLGSGVRRGLIRGLFTALLLGGGSFLTIQDVSKASDIRICGTNGDGKTMVQAGGSFILMQFGRYGTPRFPSKGENVVISPDPKHPDNTICMLNGKKVPFGSLTFR